MADFFQTLEKKYGSGGAQILSDHPNPGNRQAAIQNEIRPWPPKNYDSNTGEFARAKQDAGRVKAYSAQEMPTARRREHGNSKQKNNVVPANLPSSSNQGSGNGAGSGENTNAAEENVAFKQVKPQQPLHSV